MFAKLGDLAQRPETNIFSRLNQAANALAIIRPWHDEKHICYHSQSCDVVWVRRGKVLSGWLLTTILEPTNDPHPP